MKKRRRLLNAVRSERAARNTDLFLAGKPLGPVDPPAKSDRKQRQQLDRQLTARSRARS